MTRTPLFLLLYPPVAEPYAPYVGLPELAAVLKANGYSCRCLDLNLRAHEELLTGEVLHRAIETALSRNPPARGCRCSLNQAFNVTQHARVLRTVGPFLAERIDNAKHLLRKTDTYTFDLNGKPASDRPFFIFNRAREALFLSPLVHPFLSHSSQTHFLSASDIASAVEMHEDSLYAPFFRNQFRSPISSSPAVVGINVTFAEQLIPAILTALEVRRVWPTAVILLGGSYPTAMRTHLVRVPDLFRTIDGVACGDGEPILLGIGANLRGQLPWYHDVPNVLRTARDTIIEPTAFATWDVRQSPPPDFDDLIAEPYFAAHHQLAYATARGCYWGQCRFCDYPASHPTFRPKPLEQVCRDVSWLADRYGVRSFHVTDDAIAPRRVLGIARGLLEKRVDIAWWCLSRFDMNGGVLWSPEEVEDIRASGCYKVFFGGESASPDVQATCGKGFSVDTVRRCIESMRSTSLRVHVSFVIGMPGESLVDAEATVDWALEMAAHPHFTTRLHVFRLCRHSLMARNDSGIEWEDNEFTGLALNIARYRERSRSYDLQHEFNCLIAGAKSRFLRRYAAISGHRYPEYHNCAGLQYHLSMRARRGSAEKDRSPELHDSSRWRLGSSVAVGTVSKSDLPSQGVLIADIDRDARSAGSECVVLYDLSEDRYLVLNGVLRTWVSALASDEGSVADLPKGLSPQDCDDLVLVLASEGWIERR